MSDSYSFALLPTGRVRVDVAVASCDRRFIGIAFIHDPFGSCPMLSTPQPLGFTSIAAILGQWPVVREVYQRRESN